MHGSSSSGPRTLGNPLSGTLRSAAKPDKDGPDQPSPVLAWSRLRQVSSVRVRRQAFQLPGLRRAHVRRHVALGHGRRAPRQRWGRWRAAHVDGTRGPGAAGSPRGCGLDLQSSQGGFEGGHVGLRGRGSSRIKAMSRSWVEAEEHSVRPPTHRATDLGRQPCCRARSSAAPPFQVRAPSCPDNGAADAVEGVGFAERGQVPPLPGNGALKFRGFLFVLRFPHAEHAGGRNEGASLWAGSSGFGLI